MLPYSEGTVFFVPLRNGGYARGVVARARKKGVVLLGYFFGPRLSSKDMTEVGDLKPEKAILCVRFGDLGLINGEWSIAKTLPNWKRSDWAMPDFIRKDPLGLKTALRVRYHDADPSHVESVAPTTDAKGLSADSISGYGLVEIKLTKLLDG